MVERSNSSKVRFVPSGKLLPPAICAMCGCGGHDYGFYDPQVFVEWYGQVYFCRDCAIEIGVQADCMAPELAGKFTDSFNKLSDKNDRLEKENAWLKENIDAYSRLTGVNPLPYLNSDDEYGVSETSETLTERVVSGEGEDSGVTESTESSGPVDDSQPESSNGIEQLGFQL